MFAYEETVDDKDDNDHDDYEDEYDEWGCARACVKTDEIIEEDRRVRLNSKARECSVMR